MREFALHATDLWSGRSGVYRFRPEGDDTTRTVADTASDISWSQTPEERREREALLRELLDELDETGDDKSVRAPLLVALGDVAAMEGRLVEGRDLYQQALPPYREIGDRLGEANVLRSLGEVARLQGRYDEARDLYQQALPTFREIDDRLGEANTLRGLGEALMPTDAHSAAGTLSDGARLYRLLGRADLAVEAQRLAADAEAAD